jgi:lipid-binding SYLF domain-containing protein
MKRIGFITLAVMMIMVTAPFSVFADSHADAIAVFKTSPVVMPFFETAYAYAVFPTVGKGAFFVGAVYGKGKVYRGGTATGTATLSKMTIGPQVGGQAFREIIFFEDQRAYDEFTRGAFEFDANASAVAITAGIQAQAGSMGLSANASLTPSNGKQADTKYRKGVAVFVHIKGGLMLEAAVGGQLITFEPYQ